MKVDQGGIIVKLSSEPFIRQTSTGRVMVSGFEISNKRKKTKSGEWVDDPYYEALRVGITIFGDAADALVRSGGLAKGAEILITRGQLARPKRESTDVEVVAFEAELLKPGSQTTTTSQPRGSNGVGKPASSVDQAFDNLGIKEEDLPF